MRTSRIVLAAAALAVLTSVTPAAAQGAKLQLPDLSALAAVSDETVDVTLDKALLGLASAFLDDKGEDGDVKSLIRDVDGIYVKSFQLKPDAAYPTKQIESLRAQLSTGKWARVVHVKEADSGGTEVCFWMDNGVPGGVAILVTEPRELTIVNIVGKIDLERLRKLEGQFGIPKVKKDE